MEILAIRRVLFVSFACYRAPSDEEQHDFVSLFDDVCASFKPEVVISYGGVSRIR